MPEFMNYLENNLNGAFAMEFSRHPCKGVSDGVSGVCGWQMGIWAWFARRENLLSFGLLNGRHWNTTLFCRQ